MEGLQIRKGGQLVQTYWYAKGKVREYREKTITRRAPSLLFERTTLGRGVTLRDIFLLLQKHIDAFDAILGNWCREIVAEGLSKRRRPSAGLLKPKYLELYWHFQQETYGREHSFHGYLFPDFHGLGQKLRRSLKDQGFTWPKGSQIPYGLSFTASRELIDLPVLLRQEIEIDGVSQDKTRIKAKGAEYSLGQILYGIIWELSFFGPPESRERKAKEIFETADKARVRLNKKK